MKKFFSILLTFMLVFNFYTVFGAEKEDANVVVHDVSDFYVYRYGDLKMRNMHGGKIGSSENIKIRRPKNSTYEQDLSLFNYMLGYGGQKFNKYGQLTFSALKDDYVIDGQVGFCLERTKENQPLICCWDWDAQGGTTYSRRIECMNLAMEAFKYYAVNPEDGKAIWAYIDNAFKTHTEICDGKVHKFGQTKVRFDDPERWGVNIVFLNTGDSVNTDKKNEDKNDTLQENIDSLNGKLNLETDGNEICLFDAFGLLSDGTATVKVDNKYGIINSNGEWVMKPKFESPISFSEEEPRVAIIKSNGKYGVINTKGEWIVEPKIDSKFSFNYDKPRTAFVSVDGKYGMLKIDGTWLIEPKFDEEFGFFNRYRPKHRDHSRVKYNGKYGIINSKGEWVIEPIFPSKWIDFHYSDSDDLIAVKYVGESHLVCKDNKWVDEYDFTRAFGYTKELDDIKYNKKYGYIDRKLNWVIKPKFEYAGGFYDGKAYVEYNGIPCYINKKGEIIEKNVSLGNNPNKDMDKNELKPTKSNEKYGYLNGEFEWVIKPQFEKANNFHGDLAVVKYNGKYGFINKKGQWVIQPQFEKGYGFYDDLAFVKYNGKFGFINKKGEWVIKPQFDYKWSYYEDETDYDYRFNNGVAFVKYNGKYGAINKKGEWLIQPHAIYVRDLNDEYKCLATSNGYEIIDKNLKTMLTLDSLDQFLTSGSGEGLSSLRINKKYGFIDENYKIVIEPKFEYAFNFRDGLALVTYNHKRGFINKKGEFVIKPQFERAEMFKEGLALVQLNGKYGYINTQGDFVIKPQFGTAFSFDDGLACVEFNGKYGFIDKEGKFVIEPKYDWHNNFISGAVSKLGEDLLRVKLDDTFDVHSDEIYEVFDKNGKLLFDNKFEYVGYCWDKYLLVNINGREGLVDKEGNFMHVKRP